MVAAGCQVRGSRWVAWIWWNVVQAIRGSPWIHSEGLDRPARARQAVRAAAPVDDLGLVDLVAHVVDRGETGGGADRAVDVDQLAAAATDQVVVVVADPVLEAGGRPGGLDAPDDARVAQRPERVVHRLAGDGPDLRRTVSVTPSAETWGWPDTARSTASRWAVT